MDKATINCKLEKLRGELDRLTLECSQQILHLEMIRELGGNYDAKSEHIEKMKRDVVRTMTPAITSVNDELNMLEGQVSMLEQLALR
jgi:hypothetical protein